MIAELAWTVISWSLILPPLFSLGACFKHFLPKFTPLFSGLLYCSIGLVVLSFLALILSMCHLLQAKYIWGMLLICASLGFRSLGDFRAFFRDLGEQVLQLRKTLFGKVLLGIGFIAVFALLLGTLTPEIGGDALCYHLNLPKRFLANGNFQPLAFDDNSYYPVFMYRLYAVGLATGGVFAAKLFHLFSGLLLCLLIFVVLSEKVKNKGLSFMGALMFLLTPGIYNQLSTTYVDVALSYFIFLGVVLLIKAFESSSKRQSLIFLSGVFIGAALSIKYLAVTSILILALFWLCRLIIHRNKVTLLEIMLWGVGLLLMTWYWMIRNGIEMGNPIYPYLGSFFGVTQRPPADYFGTMGMGTGVIDFFVIFWNMFWYPEMFGAFPNRIGLFYLFLFPFSLAALFLSKKARPYFGFFFVFLLIWFFLTQADRWFYPALPFLIVLGVWGGCELFNDLKNRLSRAILRGTVGLAVMTLAVYLLGGVYHYRHAYALFLGKQPDVYLRELERSYPMADWINKNIVLDAVILVEEPSKYYFNRKLIPNKNFLWHHRNLVGLNEPSTYRDLLKSFGVTHILKSGPLHAINNTADEPLVNLTNSSFAKLVHAMESENVRDAKHYYSVYELT